jgi:hypothetical protein
MDKMNDDAFARMVAEEVKNKLSPFHKQQLIEKGNWERWRDALVLLSENLQEQIDSAEEEAESDISRYRSMGHEGMVREAKKAYDIRVKKISRFKFHVDKRLDEVSCMIETGNEMTSDGWGEADFLKRAISTHRKMLRDFDLEETSIDRALWAALNDKWLFDDIDVDSL